LLFATGLTDGINGGRDLAPVRQILGDTERPHYEHRVLEAT
jgi:hypothetical protein